MLINKIYRFDRYRLNGFFWLLLILTALKPYSKILIAKYAHANIIICNTYSLSYRKRLVHQNFTAKYQLE